MKYSFFVLALSFSGKLLTQTGGAHTFAFLDLTYNARAAGLGNDFISIKDQDINLGMANASLLNPRMVGQMSFNQALLSGGINYGMAAYGFKVKEGIVGTSVRYVSYGHFTRTEINGTSTGSFSPFDCIVSGAYGKQLNPRISVGGSLSLITSQLETYNAMGISADLSGTFTDVNDNLLVTVLVKNAGVQLKNYTSKEKDPLPVEFQMAASYKLLHAPFRFSLLAHHLNRWDITYYDPNLKPTIDALTGETIAVKYAGFGEKLARHFTYQVEILLSKNLHLRTGYDYQRRQEMKLTDRPGLSGFTFGLGMYFKKFSLDYGFSITSRAGFNHMLTISSNLAKWRK
jgi:hypothetical protein